VHAGYAVLQASHVDEPMREVDLVPSQGTKLGDAQAMPKGDQEAIPTRSPWRKPSGGRIPLDFSGPGSRGQQIVSPELEARDNIALGRLTA
jgi:hypothetical protein